MPTDRSDAAQDRASGFDRPISGTPSAQERGDGGSACVLHGPTPDFRIEAQRKAGWCKCPKPVSLNCQRDKEAESDA